MALYITDENGKLSKIAGNILTISTEGGSGIQVLLDTKVDKVDGLGLSANNYTDTDKEKLLTIEEGANKTTVDSALSTTSINPVQNAVISTELNALSARINEALQTHTTEYSALKAIVDSLLLKVYPVNSIYLSMTSTNPKTLFGGEWTLLSEGYALWTTTTSGQGGQTIAAGLPNITGEFHYETTTQEDATSQKHIKGAFTAYALENGDAVYGDDGNGSYYKFNAASGETRLDGTISNKVYGKSDTVQPPAIKVFAWKRTS